MKGFKKLTAFGCVLVLSVSMMTGCSLDEADSKETGISEQLTEELNEVSDLIVHSDTAGKEETVYAILDADGKMEETYVSTWLKNKEASRTLSDRSDLSDITVVKGDASYEKGAAENEIVWENDGSDIYYQGTSQKELPVGMNISYELDGKKVTAEELAGADGHLKIHFQYENKMSKVVTVQGEKNLIYQPFVVVSGMMLDNEKAQNIKVDHGGVTNAGDHSIIYGMALPGLSESLGLEDKDVEIPESVTIEADVQDFSPAMTLTMVSNDVLSDLLPDDIQTVDDLKADMKKLTDAVADIKDGAKQVDKGADTLKSGGKKLSNGSSDLKSGAKELADGTKDLTTGAADLSKGLTTLSSKNKDLNKGAKDLDSGLQELDQALNNETSKQQMTDLVSGSEAFNKGLTDTATGLAKITSGYDYEGEKLSALIAGLSQYADGLEAAGDRTTAAYIRTMLTTYQSLYDDVKRVEDGVGSLKDSYGQIDTGIQTAAGSVTQVASAAAKLHSGSSGLKSGLKEYTAGVAKAETGAGALLTGSQKLSAGAGSLYRGATQLSGGFTDLLKGMDDLANGTDALKSGIIKFDKEGVQKLADTVNKDLEKYLDRIRALQDYADEYNSYAGCPDDTECTVRFIYKTSGHI